MSIGEAQPLGREPVEVRGSDFSRPVAADITVAEVVGIKDDDIGTQGRTGAAPRTGK